MSKIPGSAIGRYRYHISDSGYNALEAETVKNPQKSVLLTALLLSGEGATLKDFVKISRQKELLKLLQTILQLVNSELLTPELIEAQPALPQKPL